MSKKVSYSGAFIEQAVGKVLQRGNRDQHLVVC